MINFTIQERSALAPAGVLRSTVNLGNPILARRAEGAEQPEGVSVDLAQALAESLHVDLETRVFDGAGKAVEAVAAEQADVGFFAVDPVRAQGIRFTLPYVLIEGAYLVRERSSLIGWEEVDVPGIRVAVGKGSAYDLFLTRELKHAEIVRAPTSPAVVDVFLEQGLDVAAGVRQQLDFDAARIGGLRVLRGRFMVIEQAMGAPDGRSELAHNALRRFIEYAKSEGLVREALARHRIIGASIAP